ncbi:hypothetical protein JAAARDRAFT_80270 [Jaapia argillacea MUCL 33604]|uniref:Protein kinase domain-containing protein n=1 Tax=Jaapia argillacea MUCL 33604 TaxID=933084 RepID=A0A067PTS4_9AGAM|nr:hypothetical protein JAAARDRAFT_80270 [Jaapia argillacea MUCL 33604]
MRRLEEVIQRRLSMYRSENRGFEIVGEQDGKCPNANIRGDCSASDLLDTILRSEDVLNAVEHLSEVQARELLGTLFHEITTGALPLLPSGEGAAVIALLLHLLEHNPPPHSAFLAGPVSVETTPRSGGSSSNVHYGNYGPVIIASKDFRRFGNDSEADLIRRHKNFRQEACLMLILQHERVLSSLGVVQDPYLSIISPWMVHGTLVEYVRSYELSSRQFGELLRDSLEGLAYLHGLDIIHGDVRASNIFINQDRRAVIGDLGSATAVGYNKTAISFSLRWAAPELVECIATGHGDVYNPTTKASDIYAVGMVIHEMHAKAVPFEAIPHDSAVMLKVFNGERPKRHRDITDELWNLAQRCWHPNPSNRPDVRQVLGAVHDYLRI